MKKITILGLLLMLIILSGCTFQSGTSRDLVMGYDKGIIWHHLYLKNDHTTAYCFDDPEFVRVLDEAQQNQKEVIVTYESYLIRGSLCHTGEKFDNVIVTDVKFA